MKRSKLKNTPMSTVPDDIVADILLRLPIKSLLRLRCVSNPWRNLISSPNFAKMHLKRTSTLNVEIDNHKFLVSSSSQFTSMNYNPSQVHLLDDNLELHFPTLTEKTNNIRILGSCNGLIFIRVGFQTIIIWNPSTRYFKRLLKPEYFRNRFVFGGFGFDASVDDYKVVLGCTKLLGSGNGPNKVEVFTMIPKLSSTWRKVQDIGYPDFKYEAGTFANGALHWLQQGGGAIMSFDLAEEKFGEFVTLPDSLAQKKIDVDYMELGDLQGCLCLYVPGEKKDDEVWVMKEYGVKSSWNKLFSIPYESVVSFSSYIRPLCILKSGEVLMDVDGYQLETYNPKDKSFKTIRDFRKWFETVAYVESVVSLNR